MADEDGTAEFQIILVKLLLEARRGPQPQSTLVDQLPSLLSKRAAELERADTEGELVASFQFPGYLTRTVAGTPIHVPFPLVRLFPGADILQEIIPIASDISVGNDGAICLSGSSAFLGGIQTVGDLDFCEYVFEGASMPASVGRIVGRADGPALAVMKCLEREFVHPWAGWQAGLDRFVEAGPPTGTDHRRLKLDYCAMVPALGLLPATNLVLWLDSAQPEQGNALRSFAHQEAVFDRGSGVSRTLVDAARLAAYMGFLDGEIGKLAPGNPIKALKRTLSLCSLLGIDHWAEIVLGLLNQSVVGLATREKRLAELAGLVGVLDPETRDPFNRLLDEERTALRRAGLEPTDVDEFETILRDAIEGATAALEVLVARVEVNDATQ